MNSCVAAARDKQGSWQSQLNCICRWGFKILCSRQHIQQASKSLLHYSLVCLHRLIYKRFFKNSMWSACLFLDILEIKFIWISKGQSKVTEEAMLALFRFRPKKKLNMRHTQMKNLRKTGSFLMPFFTLKKILNTFYNF